MILIIGLLINKRIIHNNPSSYHTMSPIGTALKLPPNEKTQDSLLTLP